MRFVANWICVLALAFPLGAADKEPQPTPQWTAGLKPYGYGEWAMRGGRPWRVTGAQFTPEGNVVSYFVVAQPRVSLERRNVLSSTDPYHVEVVILDGATGNLVHRADLPGRFGYTAVLAREGGELLVRSGTTLVRYGADFSVLKGRSLPHVSGVKNDELDDPAQFTPSGKRIVWSHYRDDNSIIEVIDATTLDTVSMAQDDNYPYFSVSESSILRSDARFQRLQLRGFDSQWKNIADQKSLNCPPAPLLGRFVDEQQLVATCGNRIALLNTTGEVLMRDKLSNDETVRPLKGIAVASGGRFFALRAEKIEIIGSLLDLSTRVTGMRILVYDSQTRRRIASLKVQPTPEIGLDMALSSDGSRLAIMSDDHVTLYTLPPR